MFEKKKSLFECALIECALFEYALIECALFEYALIECELFECALIECALFDCALIERALLECALSGSARNVEICEMRLFEMIFKDCGKHINCCQLIWLTLSQEDASKCTSHLRIEAY